jgi:hypothetical protein
MTIRVAVVDENEIFRRGVLACLDDSVPPPASRPPRA